MPFRLLVNKKVASWASQVGLLGAEFPFNMSAIDTKIAIMNSRFGNYFYYINKMQFY